MASGKTEQFSARFHAHVMDRLRRRVDRSGANQSRLAERYVDEGVRMDDHPGIVFRDGPTGRRAALAGGPDVWEVMATIKVGKARGQKAVAAAAKTLAISAGQVQTAVRYYAEFPEEVDKRLRRNIEEADAAEAAWEREQAALA
jgi:hypothetical protein